MFAAGVALEVGIVGAGVIVVIATMLIAGRPRGVGGDGRTAPPDPRIDVEPRGARMVPPGAPPPHPHSVLDEPAIDSGPPASRERRIVARAPVVRPVLLRRHTRVTADGGDGQQRTFAMDVSVGGVLLAGPSDLAIGELVDLSLDLDQPIGARGRVVRETADGMKGVAFEAIADSDRDRLERFVRAGQPG